MWFLIQLKRFFFISWKESFLFINNTSVKIKKLKKKCKDFSRQKGIPNLRSEPSIKLDKKYYDYYDIVPKKEKPFYLNSPLLSIIKKHKSDIINNLIDIFNNLYDYNLKIGLELEFYLINANSNTLRELKKTFPHLDIDKEKGQNQFEIKTKPEIDIKLLIQNYKKLISDLEKFAKNNGLNFILDASPFEKDCGSALQVNISLTDKDGNNLFARKKTSSDPIDNELILKIIASLLKNINSNLILFISSEDCLKRFELEKNKQLKKAEKYPAPTFISWGINNRTTSIRIPTPPMIDLENYMEEDKKNRRIEYRIPSANADIELVMIGIISSIIESLENKEFIQIEKTSFDVLENNECLEPIEDNYYILNDIFGINTDCLFY